MGFEYFEAIDKIYRTKYFRCHFKFRNCDNSFRKNFKKSDVQIFICNPRKCNFVFFFSVWNVHINLIFSILFEIRNYCNFKWNWRMNRNLSWWNNIGISSFSNKRHQICWLEMYVFWRIWFAFDLTQFVFFFFLIW